jgi:hypothetical protein
LCAASATHERILENLLRGADAVVCTVPSKSH